MIVLVHGWSFTPAVWHGVRACLPDNLPVTAVDLGFYGTPSALPPIEEIRLAVGHSYGMMWLLRQLPPSVPLLSVNGFARFCSGDGQSGGTPVRMVERMISRFGSDPLGVLDSFRARCGVTTRESGSPDSVALTAGLRALADDDQRSALRARQTVRALACADDEIAPATLSLETFPPEQLTLLPAGGHLLPLSQPARVAEAIQSMVR